MMNGNPIYNLLRYVALFGNAVYLLWILRNGINEDFRARPVELVSCVGLMFLLALNFVLLYRRG